MSSIIPISEFNEDWWKSQRLVNPIGFDNFMCNEDIPVDKGNWTLYGNYLSEPFPPDEGYRVRFPTSSDLLLWIRWVFLPSLCDDFDKDKGADVTLYGPAKIMAEEIEKNIGQKDSGEIIKSIVYDLVNLDYGQELIIYSINEIT